MVTKLRLAIILILMIGVAFDAVGQDISNLDLVELEETYSFQNPFAGQITVSFPEGWSAEGDDVSGAIMIGEQLKFSEVQGVMIGKPTHIMLAAYQSEIEIEQYDEISLFEYYAESFASAMGWDDEIDSELFQIDDRLMYQVKFEVLGNPTIFLFLHQEGTILTLQGASEDQDIDLEKLLLSIATSVEIKPSCENISESLSLDAEHSTIVPEGVIQFNYPDDWEVLDELRDQEPIVVSNDVDVYIEDQLPPLGVYGIRISGHATSQNGLLVKRPNETYSPVELLGILLGDEANDGFSQNIAVAGGSGIIHNQVVSNYALITLIFDTSDGLTVFMQGIVNARDVGQFQPIIEGIADSFRFESFFDSNSSEGEQTSTNSDSAIDENSNDASMYLSRAKSHYEQGEYEEAISNYDKVIEIDCNNVKAYHDRGLTFKKLGEYEQAIANYSQAIELDPEYIKAYYNRGISYSNLEDYEQAIADYSQVIELDPEYVAAYVNRGFTYQKLREYEQAITDYSQAIELDPEYTKAYFNRGISYFILEDYEQAITDYSQAIELDPEYAKAYSNRGNTYIKLEDYEQAIVDYGQAIELDAELVNAYFFRGLIYLNIDQDCDLARADWDVVLELIPDYPQADTIQSDLARLCS